MRGTASFIHLLILIVLLLYLKNPTSFPSINCWHPMRLDPSKSDVHLPLKLWVQLHWPRFVILPWAQLALSYFHSFIHSLSTTIFPFIYCSFICSLSSAWDVPAIPLRPSINIALSINPFLILLFPQLVNHFLFWAIYGSPFTSYQKNHILF